MPITSTEFGKSSRETRSLLLEFLRTYSYVACTVDELVGVLASQGRKVKAEEVERLLLSLEYGGRVESRIIDDVPYYKYRRVLGFVPMKKLR